MTTKVHFQWAGTGAPQFSPEPSSKHLPEWYKQAESYYGGKKHWINPQFNTPATIKRCAPFFDMLTSGYLLFSESDVQIEKKENKFDYQWANFDQLLFHHQMQAQGHPSVTEQVPKWKNDWIIKTPAGYSTLFMTPPSRGLPFQIIEGIVDTDKFNLPVLFPFIVNKPDFEGIIPAGTPIAVAIPFKRESYQMVIDEPNRAAYEHNANTLRRHFFDAYRRLFWSRKEYR